MRSKVGCIQMLGMFFGVGGMLMLISVITPSYVRIRSGIFQRVV